MGIVIQCTLLRIGYWARGRGWTGGTGILNVRLASRYVWSGRLAQDVIILGVVPLAIPWLTWLVLLIFRVSMLRARVRPQHVLRSILYSLDPSSWVIVVFLSSLFPAFATLVDPSIMQLWGLKLFLVLWSPILVMSIYRLWMAYLLYLRFDHALATVLAAVCIVVLTVINVYFQLTLR